MPPELAQTRRQLGALTAVAVSGITPSRYEPWSQYPTGRVFAYGPKLYYNPGIPNVRQFVEHAILDALTRYDIDGVHFDDYF
jgi:uncharacterized lipoprotein YddW (UPF0748 family)